MLITCQALFPLPVLYPVCSFFAKMVLLLFYLRLSPVQWFKWSIYFAMFFLFSTQVAIFFAAIFPCKPVAKAWDPFLEGTCIDQKPIYQATAITGVISDVFLIAIPIPMVVKLQLPRRQKIGLMLMFMVGAM